MARLWESLSRKRVSGLTRRELGRLVSFLVLGGLVPSRRLSAAEASAFARRSASGMGAKAAVGLETPADVYRALGVRPLINCRGTITVIGGSIELPEVRAAKSLANQQHVQIDELMAAAGKRLAELTGAEWGMVTAGCAAAMSHATAACVAGGNPDLHVRIPDLTGFARDEVNGSMMAPGDEKIVADRVYHVLSMKHAPKPVDTPRPPAANLSGQWEIEIQYTASKTTHAVHLQQDGNRLEGIHRGNFLARDIAGTISGDTVSLMSNVTERHGDALRYQFNGTIAGDTMSGTLDMGEYLSATWVGRRHAFGQRG